MTIYNDRLTPVQAAIAKDLVPDQVDGDRLTFTSAEEIDITLARVRAIELSATGGKLRAVRTLAYKLEQINTNPYAYIKPTHLTGPVLATNDVMINTTKAQTTQLRDVHKIKGVRWASMIGHKTQMYVSRDHYTYVIEQLMELASTETHTQTKRVFTTTAKKLEEQSGEAAKQYVSLDLRTKRFNCLKYVAGVCGVEVNEKATEFADMIPRESHAEVIEELKVLGSLIFGADGLAWAIIEELSPMNPVEVEEDKLFEKELHWTELAPIDVTTDLEPSPEDLAQLELELERETQLDLFPEAEPDATPEEEADWISLDDYCQAEEADAEDWDDEDEGYSGWIVVSRMTATLEWFGKDELIALGAEEWDGDEVIFKDAELRDIFCDALYEREDQEMWLREPSLHSELEQLEGMQNLNEL